MSRYISPRLSSLTAYIPGEQPKEGEYIKLNANESAYPPSPKVRAVIDEERKKGLRLYSDSGLRELRRAAADYYGVDPENVTASNGSDDMLSYAFLAFCDKDRKLAFPDITYSFYPVLCKLYGIEYDEIALKENYTVGIEDYFGLGRSIIIANPNAPTGIALSTADIIRIIEANRDNVVMIDEAYVDFGGESVVPLVKKYDNLLVIQTFSKSRSLAGARLGFGFGDKELIRDIDKIRCSINPYNINSLSLAAGKAAFEDRAYYDEINGKIQKSRERLSAELAKRGFCVLPSRTNFVFAKKEGFEGAWLLGELRKRGILVRHFNMPRIDDFLRITIGTEEQNDRLLAAFDESI